MTRFLLWIEGIASWTGVILFLGLMIIGVGLVIWKLGDKSPKGFLSQILIAVIVLTCSIPLVSSITFIAENKAKTFALSEKKAELELIQTEAENEALRKERLALENENLVQSVTIGKLNEEINLLKNTRLSIEKFKEICEVALLEAELKNTDVKKQTLSTKYKKPNNISKGRTDTDILIIKTRNVIAKYGIDLNEIKIHEDNNKLYISNINLKNIGLVYPEQGKSTETIISEVREAVYDDKQQNTSTKVLNDRDSLRLINAKSEEFDNEWRKRVSQNPEQENAGLSQAVKKLGERFIEVILSPLGKEIVFEDSHNYNGVSIFEYIDGRVNSLEAEKSKKTQSASKNNH